MLLDAATAKALAAIILISTQGVERLTPQLPLQIIERGEDWLVKGTYYEDTVLQTKYNAFWIFFRKTSAEVVGIGFDARAIPTAEDLDHLERVLSFEEIVRISGPRSHWQPGGSEFAKFMDMNVALYGCLINKPADAVAYARVLMSTNAKLASVPETALQAEERDTVWHITESGRGEIMTFSRVNG